MRCVLDTNVLVSGLLWHGNPARLIELAGEGEIQLYTSRPLLEELTDVLHRRKFAKAILATGFTVAQILSHYRRVAYRVTPVPMNQQFSRDLDDDQVLACALAAKAKLIASGDKDLLILKSFSFIPIVTAAEAVKIITRL